MTAEEFARGYAERSGVTVEWLRAHGGRHGEQWPEPCDCGEPGCRGWQMASHERDGRRMVVDVPPEGREREDAT